MRALLGGGARTARGWLGGGRAMAGRRGATAAARLSTTQFSFSGHLRGGTGPSGYFTPTSPCASAALKNARFGTLSERLVLHFHKCPLIGGVFIQMGPTPTSTHGDGSPGGAASFNLCEQFHMPQETNRGRFISLRRSSQWRFKEVISLLWNWFFVRCVLCYD